MKAITFFKPGMAGHLVALIAGMLLTLAFAPFNIFPFAIISPALLLGTWLYCTPKMAFWRGYIFGAGLYSTSVYWVFISIYNFGNAPVALAIFITILFIIILSTYLAVTGYLLNRYFPYINDTKMICAFPALWVFFEWVRSWLFSGFPWILLGTSQVSSPLKGYAPLLGVYGVSLAVAISSGLIVSAIIKSQQEQTYLARKRLGQLILIWVIGGLLSFISWTKPFGQPIKISLIQGNISQEVKWSPDHLKTTIDQYLKLSASHWDSKTIIWPEAAIPLLLQNAGNIIDVINRLTTQHHNTLITGVPVKAEDKEGYYNSMITLGQGKGTYVKHRLVPFGEFTPLHAIFGRLLTFLDVPMSDFIPGMDFPKPLELGNIKIATFICYEIAYAEQVLSRNADVNVILTASNDAWFGKSIAQAQHLQMAQMRSLEMGRPMLFASNSGITAFIKPNGNIQSAAPPYVPYALTDWIQPTHGKTPWQYFAMDPVLLFIMILLFVAFRRHKA